MLPSHSPSQASQPPRAREQFPGYAPPTIPPMPASLIAKAIQSKLASSGLEWVKLESFTLSSRDKAITVELSLDGEDQPVKIDIHYSLGAENTVVIREVETSRKWMTEALKLALVKTGNRFTLPGGLKGKMLKVLL